MYSVVKIPPETLRLHLAQLPMLCELTTEELDQIVASSRVMDLDREHIVFNAGIKLGGCYCVMRGQVKLSIIAPNGAEKIIELIGPGMSFGEALLFLDAPSPVTAQAIERSRIAFIPKSLIFNLIEHSSQFTYRILAGMSQRLHHLVADLEAFCLQTSSQRVIGYLLNEAKKKGALGKSANVILPTNKNLIASKLNLTPETFSRTLHHLAEEGLLTVSRKNIDIPDVEQLRQVSQT